MNHSFTRREEGGVKEGRRRQGEGMMGRQEEE